MATALETESDRPSEVLGNVLGNLGRCADIERYALEDVLRNVTETAARTLAVARVNVWLYSADRSEITCVEAYDVRTGMHQFGEVLSAAEFPEYFAALDRLRNIAAMDAQNDPRTRELAPGYLLRHGVTTMLDVPILRSGQVAGVVCHEHIHTVREWTQTDRLFAGSIGDLVALILETNERIAAERTNALLVERLGRMDRIDSLGWLAGSVAHDFRNLLFVILTGARALGQELRDAGQGSAGVQAMLRDVEDAGARANELCAQLLTYSGQTPLTPRPVDLPAVAEEMLRLLRARVPPGRSLRLDVVEGVAPVRADPTQVRQVLLNLILNALDALPDGAGSVTVRVRVEAPDKAALRQGYDFRRNAEPTVVLEVSDDGSGMSDETLRRLFEPLYTTKPNGHGIGLAAVLGIVRSHGGALSVESRPAAGTRVRIFLPLA